MNKPLWIKIAFCGIILTAVFWYGWTQAQSIESDEYDAFDLGRDNPFADFVDNEEFTAQGASQDSKLVGEKPRLFLETIPLKSISAESFKAVRAYGSPVQCADSVEIPVRRRQNKPD